MMCLNRVVRGAGLVMVSLWLAGCPGPSTTPVATSISVTPSAVAVEVGKTQALTVTATYDDGTSAVLTTGLTYTSTEVSVASVSPAGIVTGVARGTTTVTVASGSLIATVAVTVSSTVPAKTLSSIGVSPSPVSLKVGSTQALTVTATYSDSSTAALTSQATFSSSNWVVATVSAAGLVTAVSPGETIIEASAAGKSARVTVTVTPATPAKTLSSLALTPSPVSLQVGSKQALTVTATYSDASTAVLSSQITFTSSTPSVATVSDAGLVTAISAGATTIEATSAGKSAQVTVTVTAATLNSVAIEPTAADVFVGHTKALSVVGSFSDGTTATITSGVTFVSSAVGVATVGASDGVVTGVTLGTSDITATAQGKSAKCTVTVRLSPYVFFDQFESNASFVGFAGATNDVARDSTELRDGRASLKAVVPAKSLGYAGGAIAASVKRDLSSFDALTFWAKASADTTINVLGVGNNGAGTTGFEAELTATSLTTTWKKVVIPLADPSRLTEVDGLFHFADAAKDSSAGGYTVWFSDLQFEKLGATVLGAPSATINLGTVAPVLSVGDTFALSVGDSIVDYTIDGALVRLTRPGWGFFALTSSAPNVATVSPAGVVTGAGVGQATITATLGGAAVSGSFVVTVTPKTAPTTVLAPPSLAAADVISLSTTGYTNHGVDSWRTEWSNATFEDLTIEGHTVKHYTSLNFVGVETKGANLVDASAMTAFHIDVWTPNATAFRVKLVDFGDNREWGDGLGNGGGDDTEAEVSLNSSTTPALTTGGWVAIEIPLSDFTAKNPAFKTSHLAQLIFSADPSGAVNVYVDNIYFHR